MPKHKLKAWLPKREQLHENRFIRYFAPRLADPRLWHLNRGSINRAIYVGVVCALFPFPGQMPLSIIGAILFRANVPMAIALTWLTNPLTTIPIMYAAYCIGAYLLGEPMISLHLIKKMLISLEQWIVADGANPFVTYYGTVSIWALILGLVIVAVVGSVVGSIVFNLLWRYHVTTAWRSRKKKSSQIED